MQEIIKYQEIDSQLRKTEQELRQSLNKKNATDMQQYLKDGQAKLIKLDESAKNLAVQYQKAISLYNEFVAKLETLAKKIDEVDSSKIIEIENTINNFSTTAENLEANIGNLANRIAMVNKEVENIMNNAKKAKHNLEIYKSNYNKEREKAEPIINELKQKLEKQKANVSASLLSKYLSKVESNIFPVFTEAQNGRCGKCKIEIPAGKISDLKSKGIIECEHCGRLIYIK